MGVPWILAEYNITFFALLASINDNGEFWNLTECTEYLSPYKIFLITQLFFCFGGLIICFGRHFNHRFAVSLIAGSESILGNAQEMIIHC